MKIYTEEPKRGNARKAWRFLTKHNPWAKDKPPKEMFYSPKCDDNGRCWVGHWGTSFSYGTYGATGHDLFDEVQVSELWKVNDDGDWDTEVMDAIRETFESEKTRIPAGLKGFEMMIALSKAHALANTAGRAVLDRRRGRRYDVGRP